MTQRCYIVTTFARREDGAITVFGLFLAVSMICIGGPPGGIAKPLSDPYAAT